MPKVMLEDKDGDYFIGMDQCFCFMGKDSCYLEAMAENLDNAGVGSVTSLSYQLFKDVKPTSEMRPILNWMREKLPFMRVIDDFDEAFDELNIRVDAEEYSFNEIQHCWWWIRYAITRNAFKLFNKGIEKGLHPDMAFLASLFTSQLRSKVIRADSDGDSISRQLYDQWTGDENIIDFRGLSALAIFPVLSGEYEREYCGMKYQDLLNEYEEYEKNLEGYGLDCTSPEGERLVDSLAPFFQEEEVQEEREYIPVFGGNSRSRSALSEAEKQDAILKGVQALQPTYLQYLEDQEKGNE